jgi:hypothetical protein
MHATDNELDMACEIMKAACIAIAITIVTVCAIFYFGGPEVLDAMLIVVRPIFHLFGG